MKRSALRNNLMGMVFVTLLAACATTEPTRFYSLAPDTEAATQTSLEMIRIGVVPPILPEYLNRPQIVTRTSATKLEIAELERWVEPLDQMALRVLVQNLSSLTGSDHVLSLPQRRPMPFDRFVEVQIMRFDTGPEGMTLDARWSIFDGQSEDLLASKRTVITEPIDPISLDRFDAIARAMSRGFGELSAEIIAAMNAETS